MNKQQERKLTESKLVMLRQMPYYGQFVIGTPILVDTSIPTACTSGHDIRINPDWLLGKKGERPRSEVVFVLGHEVLHITFKHMLRIGFRDPRLWNVACDFAINLLLHEGQVGTMPEPDLKKGEVKLLDMRFKDMTAETIYDILEKERQKQGGGQKFKSNGITIDLSKQDPGGSGYFEAPDLSDEQKDLLERQINAKVSSSAASAKMAGKLPAGLERMVKTALKPIVDWRDRLRQFVARMFPAEYSWARPNRRFVQNDQFLYSTEKTGVGEILVVMDTSGSVDYSSPTSEGAQYYSEIKAIFEDCSPSKLHVMYCDATVAGYDVFEQGEEPELRPRGGGGTDFRPPFDMIDKDGIDIQCAIYLTDGYGPFPKKPMPYPVLWVITTDVAPPWGEHVKLHK